MTRYILSPEAIDDLDQIKTYLLKRGGRPLARYIVAELRRSVRFLADTPGAGHSRADLTPELVKFWPVFSYLIVYDPLARPVAIVRVLHGNRDLEALFMRPTPTDGI